MTKSQFGVGVYQFSQPIVLSGLGQGIVGRGRGRTLLRFTGASGVAITVRPASFSSSQHGTSVIGFTLEGQQSESASGFSFGDLVGASVDDVRVRYFPGDGIIMANVAGWTEQSDISVMSGGNKGCQILMDGADNASITASFMYNKMHFRMHIPAGADGLRMRRGANLFGGTFDCIFNADRSTSSLGTVLTVGEATDVASCGIVNVGLRFTGEANGSGSSPVPLVLAQSAAIRDAGVVWFNGSGWATPSIPSGRISFTGRWSTGGVESRQPFLLGSQVVGGVGYRSHASAVGINGSSVTLDPNGASSLRVALGHGAHTIVWGGGVADGTSAGMEFDVFLMVIQPESGAAGTVAWPSITWIGGSNPQLKTAPGAVDYFRLHRMPNGNWFGHHLNP